MQGPVRLAGFAASHDGEEIAFCAGLGATPCSNPANDPCQQLWDGFRADKNQVACSAITVQKDITTVATLAYNHPGPNNNIVDRFVAASSLVSACVYQAVSPNECRARRDLNNTICVGLSKTDCNSAALGGACKWSQATK